MNTEEKLTKLLELQEAGLSIDDIYVALGFGSSKTLNNFANRNGYRLDRKSKKYVPKESDQEAAAPVERVGLDEVSDVILCNTDSHTMDNTICKTSSHTDCSTCSDVAREESSTTIEPQAIMPIVLNDFIDVWENDKDTFKEMLRWFKVYKGKSESDMILELPKADNTMISLRSNAAIWEQFGTFAQNYKGEFSKGDLLAQALKEFMEKYQ